MRISTKSRYGLRAMSFLAKVYPKVVSAKEIAKEEKIPFEYLEKILIILEKAGFVSPKRGVNGGYFLSLAPERINLAEVLKVLEEDLSIVPCRHQEKSYSRKRKKCPIRKVWKEMQEALEKRLESITLDTLTR